MIESIPQFPQAAGTAFDYAKVPNYEPEIWQVKKDDIYSAIHVLGNAVAYAKDLLIEHDAHNGRTTKRNKDFALGLEADIKQMEQVRESLRGYPNP